MTYDYPQLAADIINNLPDGSTPADARRALQELDPLDQTAALAVNSGGGGGSGGSHAFNYQETPISSAEILALYDSPIQITDAPPADKAIVPLFIALVVTAGTVPYVLTDILQLSTNGLVYGPGLSTCKSVLDTPDVVYAGDLWPLLSAVSDSEHNTTRRGAPIDISAATSNPTDGDMDVIAQIAYLIVS